MNARTRSGSLTPGAASTPRRRRPGRDGPRSPRRRRSPARAHRRRRPALRQGARPTPGQSHGPPSPAPGSRRGRATLDRRRPAPSPARRSPPQRLDHPRAEPARAQASGGSLPVKLHPGRGRPRPQLASTWRGPASRKTPTVAAPAQRPDPAPARGRRRPHGGAGRTRTPDRSAPAALPPRRVLASGQAADLDQRPRAPSAGPRRQLPAAARAGPRRDPRPAPGARRPGSAGSRTSNALDVGAAADAALGHRAPGRPGSTPASAAAPVEVAPEGAAGRGR